MAADADATSLNLMIDISASIESLTKDIKGAVSNINTQFAEISSKLNEELKSAFGMIDTKIEGVSTSITDVTQLLKAVNIDDKSFKNIEKIFDSIIGYGDKFAKELDKEKNPLVRMLQLFTSIKDVIIAKNDALIIEAKLLKEEPDALKEINRHADYIKNSIRDSSRNTIDWGDNIRELIYNIGLIESGFRSINKILKVSNEQNEKFAVTGYRKYGSPQEIQQQVLKTANSYRILNSEAEKAFIAMARVGGIAKKEIGELTGVTGQFIASTDASIDSMTKYVRQARLAKVSNQDIAESLGHIAKISKVTGLLGDALTDSMVNTTVTAADLQRVFGNRIDYSQYIKMRTELAGVANEAGLGADAFGKLFDTLATGGAESAVAKAFAGVNFDVSNIKTTKDMAAAVDQLSGEFNRLNAVGEGAAAQVMAKSIADAMGITIEQANALLKADQKMVDIYTDMNNEVKKLQGGLAEINDERNKTTWRQLKLLGEGLYNVLYQIGAEIDKVLVPVLQYLNTAVMEGVEAWTWLIEEIKKALPTFESITAALEEWIPGFKYITPYIESAANAIRTLFDTNGELGKGIRKTIGIIIVGGMVFFGFMKIITLSSKIAKTAGLVFWTLGKMLGLVGAGAKTAAGGVTSAASTVASSKGIFSRFFDTIAEGIDKFAKAATKNAVGIAALSGLLVGIGIAVYAVAQAMLTLSTIKNLGEVSAVMAGIVVALSGLIGVAMVAGKAAAGMGKGLAILAAFAAGAVSVLYAIVNAFAWMATILERVKTTMVELFDALAKYDAVKLNLLVGAVAGMGWAMLNAAPGMITFAGAMIVLSFALTALGVVATAFVSPIERIRMALFGISMIDSRLINDLSDASYALAKSIISLGAASLLSFMPLAAFGGLLGAFAVAAIIVTPIIHTLSSALERLVTVLERLNTVAGIDLKGSGIKLMTTFAEGISSATSYVTSAIYKAFGKVARYLPHSNAEMGPFSDLTGSGSSILETMASGIISDDSLTDAISKQFGKVSNMALETPEVLAGNTKSWWMDMLSSIFGDSNTDIAPIKPTAIPQVPVYTEEDRKPKEKNNRDKAIDDLLNATIIQSNIVSSIYTFLVDADPKHLNKLDELIKSMRSGSGGGSGEFGNNTILNNWT